LEHFLDGYDYVELVNIIRQNVDGVIAFLDSKIAKARLFRSKKTGLTFTDVKSDLSVVKDFELRQVQTIIKGRAISRDREQLIAQYQYDVRNIEAQRKKKQNEADVAAKLLKDIRQRDSSSMPGGREIQRLESESRLIFDSSFLDRLRKDNSYSFLVKTALDAEVQARNLGVDKEGLQEDICILKEKEKEKEKEEEKETTAYVEKALRSIVAKVVVLSQRANDLNIDFLKRVVDGAVVMIKEPQTYETRSKSPLKLTTLTMVVAFFLAIFIAFFLEYVKKAARKTES